MSEVTPAELARAASALVQRSLGVGIGANLVVICDAESAAIGHAIARAAEAHGGRATLARLDEMRSLSTNHTGERPHKVLPDGLKRAMNVAQASVFVASAPQKELSMREQLFHLASSHGVRHAHMPDITARAFVQSFALPYDRVALWGKGMRGRLQLARKLTSVSPAGTNLDIELGDTSRWVPRLGDIAAGACVALPAGAIFGAPYRVDGVFVANASVGEFFGAREGLLLRNPVRFAIAESRVTGVEAPGAPELESDLKKTLAIAQNSDRVGLVAVGVNMGIEAPTGMAAVDENLPGLHLVIGDPAGRHTGVPWTARTTFAACQAGSRVSVDGAIVIDEGKVVSVV